MMDIIGGRAVSVIEHDLILGTAISILAFLFALSCLGGDTRGSSRILEIVLVTDLKLGTHIHTFRFSPVSHIL
jgi:hypothetical protein